MSTVNGQTNADGSNAGSTDRSSSASDSSPSSSDQIKCRRALEALRAGVPNRDAVAALGSLQTGVEDHFGELLDALRARALDTGALTPGAGGSTDVSALPGMLIGGGFGSGKSHVLEYLAHRALDANFVVSKVVISKETPLHDPVKLYRAFNAGFPCR